jgi:hypothetical protein
MPNEKSLLDKIIDLLRSKSADVPEKASEVLPPELMPREAVLLKRKQYADIDKNLEENR